MERNWSGPNEHRELVQLSAIRVRRWGTSSTHTQLPPTSRTRKLAGHVSLGTSATVATPLPRRDGELLVVDQLKLTVKPRLNPTLSQYLINLTGITQREVDEDGVTLSEALRSFYVFCGGAWSNFLPTASFGGDHEVLLENIALHNKVSEADELTMYAGWLAAHHDVVPFFVNFGLDRSGFSSGTLHRCIPTVPQFAAQPFFVCVVPCSPISLQRLMQGVWDCTGRRHRGASTRFTVGYHKCISVLETD